MKGAVRPWGEISTARIPEEGAMLGLKIIAVILAAFFFGLIVFLGVLTIPYRPPAEPPETFDE
jgi:hypothetical protein